MEGEGVEAQAQGGHAEPLNNKDDLALTKGSTGKKRKQREFTSPASDRPARERKSIERFIVAPEKEVKEFKIQKGAGTALKDIPNIVFKLSKRRGGDEVVQALHRVLFGKTAARHVAKSNILQFSGYVWSGNEEKEKTKVKEKLEKFVKESLFQISDLLDLPLSKTLKKEDGVLKVFEFLESPYKTSDKLIEASPKAKKSKKAKKTPVKGLKKKASGKTPRKSPKVAKKKTSRKKKASDEEDESDAGDFEDDVEEEPEEKSDDNYIKESGSSKKRKRKSPKKESVQEKSDAGDFEDDVEEEPEEKNDDNYIKESNSSKKRKRKSPKKESVQESEAEEETSPKKEKPVKKGKKKPIQEAKKEKKPKAKDEKVKEPSNKDLQEAICVLLQDADFSKVTFTDVMKQLSQKFNTDLTHKKTHLKALIHEEIHKLVGEGDNEDEDGNNEGEIDDTGDKANGDEQEEHEDASGGLKAEDEEEDGDENIAEGDGDEDGDDNKPDGEDEDEDGNSAEVKADGEDEVEDAKEEEDHDAVAEEDSTDMA